MDLSPASPPVGYAHFHHALASVQVLPRRPFFVPVHLKAPYRGQRLVATVPLSTVGVEYLDQRPVAHQVLSIVAAPAPFRDRLLRALGAVQLTSEQAVPPAGKLGAYVTGEHLYVAERDQAGLPLFWQIDGPVTRTNMILFLTDPITFGPDAQGIQPRE